jgi:hypothetical protein
VTEDGAQSGCRSGSIAGAVDEAAMSPTDVGVPGRVPISKKGSSQARAELRAAISEGEAARSDDMIAPAGGELARPMDL